MKLLELGTLVFALAITVAASNPAYDFAGSWSIRANGDFTTAFATLVQSGTSLSGQINFSSEFCGAMTARLTGSIGILRFPKESVLLNITTQQGTTVFEGDLKMNLSSKTLLGQYSDCRGQQIVGKLCWHATAPVATSSHWISATQTAW